MNFFTFFSTTVDGLPLNEFRVLAEKASTNPEYKDEKNRKVEFTVKDNSVELNANINVKDWNGAEAIKALNKACEEKHTGKDKESVLWPDVDVLVRTRLIKDCK